MLIFLKLGGSLITDKSQVEQPRPDVIDRIAGEIEAALRAAPGVRLLIGHGSGSFGHSAASVHGTRQGVTDARGWRGFAEVGVVAGRLNHIVLEALAAAGVPVFRVQPSASAWCQDGTLVHMELRTITGALRGGLVPLVYGDVAFDDVRGGTIISTEEILDYLACELRPRRILLAGSYEGVIGPAGQVVRRITPQSISALGSALQGSDATDVTGGMASKVRAMLAVCQRVPGLEVRIFSGSVPGNIQRAITGEDVGGTIVTADDPPAGA
jgi:isopentenyl phosphate kinase